MKIYDNKQRKIELVCEYYSLEINHEYDKWDRSETHYCSESTSDCYDVYVVYEGQDSSVDLGTNVFYYVGNMADRFLDDIKNHVKDFYIDTDIWEDAYLEDVLEELFEELIEEHEVNDFFESVKLTDKEIKELKEQYEIEDEAATNA
tara:strand:+ start:174 stop:614 length:441 start_codon:yes stop_codon:yes gene_type:complete